MLFEYPTLQISCFPPHVSPQGGISPRGRFQPVSPAVSDKERQHDGYTNLIGCSSYRSYLGLLGYSKTKTASSLVAYRLYSFFHLS